MRVNVIGAGHLRGPRPSLTHEAPAHRESQHATILLGKQSVLVDGLSLLSKSADLTKRYQYMSEWAMYPRNQVMVTYSGYCRGQERWPSCLSKKILRFQQMSPNLRLQDSLVSLKMGTTPAFWMKSLRQSPRPHAVSFRCQSCAC